VSSFILGWWLNRGNSVSSDRDRIDRLYRLTEFPVDLSGSSRSGCDTFWAGNPASRYALNCGYFEYCVLMIANGLEITRGTSSREVHHGWGDFGNALIWAASHPNLQLELDVMDSVCFKGADTVLHKDKLRQAYRYYRAAEVRDHQRCKLLLSQGVDLPCLLWLTAMLGRWFIYEAFAQSIGGVPEGFNYDCNVAGLTPFLVAVHLGRLDVVRALLTKKIDRNCRVCYHNNEPVGAMQIAIATLDPAIVATIQVAKYLKDTTYYPLSDTEAARIEELYTAALPIELTFEELLQQELTLLKSETILPPEVHYLSIQANTTERLLTVRDDVSSEPGDLSSHSENNSGEFIDYHAAWILLQPNKSSNPKELAALLEELCLEEAEDLQYIYEDLNRLASVLKNVPRAKFCKIFGLGI
jgi:hypothetical protein